MTETQVAPETVAQETQTAPIEKQWFQELGFQNAEEAKTFYETAKPVYEKFKEVDYDAVLREKEVLSQTIKEGEGKIKPVNEFVATLNEMLSKGANPEQVDAYWKLSKVDLDTLPAKEAKVLRLVFEEGLSKEKAELLVSSEYKTDPSQYDELDESKANQLAELAKIKLEREAKKDAQYLKQLRKELTVTEAQKQNEQQMIKNQEFEKQVDQVATNFKYDFGTIKVDINETPVEFEYKPSEAFLKEVPRIVKSIAIQNNTTDTAQLKTILDGLVKANEFDRILKATAEHYLSVNLLNEKTKDANGTGKKPAAVPQPQTGFIHPQGTTWTHTGKQKF